MATAEKIFLIVNPIAGKGSIAPKWGQLVELFSKKGIRFSHAFTNAKGHSHILVKEALLAGYRTLLVVGGDGTLNEVLNGIFSQQHVPSQEITIGVLPIGSGNDWARSQGIPTDLPTFVDSWEGLKVIRHDVGRVRYLIGKEKQSRYFMNISSFGFGGKVVHRVERFKNKLRFPSLAYLVGLLTSLMRYKEVSMTVHLDQEKIEGEVFNISIGNGRFFGNGMCILPHAAPNNGLFAISLVKKISRGKVVANLDKLYKGSYVKLPEVMISAHHTALLESKTLFLGETDGEPLPASDFFEVEILPRAIRIMSHQPPPEQLHNRSAQPPTEN